MLLVVFENRQQFPEYENSPHAIGYDEYLNLIIQKQDFTFFFNVLPARWPGAGINLTYIGVAEVKSTSNTHSWKEAPLLEFKKKEEHELQRLSISDNNDNQQSINSLTQPPRQQPLSTSNRKCNSRWNQPRWTRPPTRLSQSTSSDFHERGTSSKHLERGF